MPQRPVKGGVGPGGTLLPVFTLKLHCLQRLNGMGCSRKRGPSQRCSHFLTEASPANDQIAAYLHEPTLEKSLLLGLHLLDSRGIRLPSGRPGLPIRSAGYRGLRFSPP
jgi:hypothetical protein